MTDGEPQSPLFHEPTPAYFDAVDFLTVGIFEGVEAAQNRGGFMQKTVIWSAGPSRILATHTCEGEPDEHVSILKVTTATDASIDIRIYYFWKQTSKLNVVSNHLTADESDRFDKDYDYRHHVTQGMIDELDMGLSAADQVEHLDFLADLESYQEQFLR